MKDLDVNYLAELFKALGETNRINIFKYMCQCASSGQSTCSVGDVASCCDVDMSVVSRHLSTLKKAGVVSATKNGKQVNYSLNSKELAKALRSLADLVENCCNCKCN